MVTIIRQGSNPDNQPIQTTCGHCRTVFQFLPHEARYTSDQRDGDFYTINCPHCGHTCTKDKPGYRGPYN